MAFTYVDYDYYNEVYKGKSIDKENFDYYSQRASAYLDSITQNKISKLLQSNIENNIKNACCAVIEVIAQSDNGGEVASVSNDGYSETYITSGRTYTQKMYDAACLFLNGTGLLCSWI